MSNESLGIDQLVAEYVQSGDISDAISVAEDRTMLLMREYPEGVPSGVMLTGSSMAIEWIGDLLARMLIEIAGEVHGWSKEDQAEQVDISTAIFRLMRAHAQNVALAMWSPKESDDG